MVGGVGSLFDRWHRPLLRFLRTRVRDGAAAEDIAQDAFVRLLDQPPARRPRDARAWLFAVAANLAADHARRAQGRERRLALVRAEAAGAGPAAGGSDPHAELLRAEEAALVRAALAALSDRDRTLLTLHNDGYAYAEIAAALGVAPGSVGPLLARAQRRFVRTFTLMEGSDARHASG